MLQVFLYSGQLAQEYYFRQSNKDHSLPKDLYWKSKVVENLNNAATICIAILPRNKMDKI